MYKNVRNELTQFQKSDRDNRNVRKFSWAKISLSFSDFQISDFSDIWYADIMDTLWPWSFFWHFRINEINKSRIDKRFPAIFAWNPSDGSTRSRRSGWTSFVLKSIWKGVPIPWNAAGSLSTFSLNIDNRVNWCKWCFCHHMKRYIHICLCVFTFWHRYQGFDIVSCSHLMLPRDLRISNTVSINSHWREPRWRLTSL